MIADMRNPSGSPPVSGQRRIAAHPQRDDFALLGYAAVCMIVVAGGVFVWREQFGTHRPLIHVVSILLASIYVVLARRTKATGPLELLGLRPPQPAAWAWSFLLLGVATAAARFLVYRWTGLGGIQLYRQEFVGFLSGTSPGQLLLHWVAFPPLVYLAVLVPGAFFFGVVQESFRRAGMPVAGVFLQALLFGWVHCFMTGQFDLVYGFEAFGGGLAFGAACHWLRNVYVPAILLAANVVTATFLAAI